jgi:hypothetical protein
MRRRLVVAGAIATAALLMGSACAAAPLRVHPKNPRWFADGSGRAVYLTGSHVWWNLVGPPTWPGICPGSPRPFSYDAYLDLLQQHGHNFIRLWRIELTRWHECGQDVSVNLHPWQRTGPDSARDGQPKFDLSRFDESYFAQLRQRVQAAGSRGIYVSVMLFEGWSVQFAEPPWRWEGHPFHPDNNVNGVNGDVNGDGSGIEIHTMENPAVVALEEAYVRKVVDTVGDLDNVLYEIANETGVYSTEWQYHMIRFIKALEAQRGKRHPVGMTFQNAGGSSQQLLQSPADWISPMVKIPVEESLRARKVVLLDTDHVCGVCVDETFPWKAFLEGQNPLFMDPLDDHPGRALVRRGLGQTRRYARRIDLVSWQPRGSVSTTGFAMSSRGGGILAYQPGSGPFTVNLRGHRRRVLRIEWLNVATGATRRGAKVRGGRYRRFSPPFEGQAVLFLRVLPPR